MTTNIWQGQKIRLRAVEPEDWSAYLAWNEDSEAERSSYFIPFPPAKAWMKQRLEKEAQTAPDGDTFRFQIETLEGELVGTINTTNASPRHGTFGYGLSIKRAARRQGYATEAIKLILNYYFCELRYQKVTVHIYDFNQPSIKLHQRLGFQQEGRLRRMGHTKGAYYDELIFGMTKEEFAAQHQPGANSII